MNDASSSVLDAGSRRGSAPRGLLSELGVILIIVLSVITGVLGIRTYVVEAYVIQGRSMEPTFRDSERLLVSKLSAPTSLARGDIVVFQHPDEPEKRLIKRVVALPGETVRLEEGWVYVNGQRLEESYLTPESHDGSYMRSLVVEPDHYFVLGDNRDLSNDSRRMGTISAQAIVGKALALFYPKIRFL